MLCVFLLKRYHEKNKDKVRFDRALFYIIGKTHIIKESHFYKICSFNVNTQDEKITYAKLYILDIIKYHGNIHT